MKNVSGDLESYIDMVKTICFMSSIGYTNTYYRIYSWNFLTYCFTRLNFLRKKKRTIMGLSCQAYA